MQDDAEDVRPETLKVEKGKKGAKQNKDQTQMRIAKMRVSLQDDCGQSCPV